MTTARCHALLFRGQGGTPRARGCRIFFFRRAEGVPVDDRSVPEAVAGGDGASPCKMASADTPRTNDVLLMDRNRSVVVPSWGM